MPTERGLGTVTPAPQGTRVIQGAIEKSNVNPVVDVRMTSGAFVDQKPRFASAISMFHYLGDRER